MPRNLLGSSQVSAIDLLFILFKVSGSAFNLCWWDSLLWDPSRWKVWTHHGKSSDHAVKNTLLDYGVIVCDFEDFDLKATDKLFLRLQALHRIPGRPG